MESKEDDYRRMWMEEETRIKNISEEARRCPCQPAPCSLLLFVSAVRFHGFFIMSMVVQTHYVNMMFKGWASRVSGFVLAKELVLLCTSNLLFGLVYISLRQIHVRFQNI